MLAAIAVATIGTAVLVTATNSQQPDDTILDGSLASAVPGQIAAGAFGVLVVCGEYSSGTIRPTFAACPRRLTVLTAKTGSTPHVRRCCEPETDRGVIPLRPRARGPAPWRSIMHHVSSSKRRAEVIDAVTATSPIMVGLVGLGWWGDRLAQAMASGEDAALVSCFARSPHRRADFAARHRCKAASSFEQLLGDPDIDAIVVATPHSTHAGLVSAAASKGKHVFVEKPLGLSVTDGLRAHAAAEEAGVVLQVGYDRRKRPANRAIRSMIDNGELGMLHAVQATMSVSKDQVPRPGWRSDLAECPVGGMTALGVHMVDTFRYFCGPVARVFAMSKQLWGAGRLDDVTVVCLEFCRGPVAQLTTSLVVPKTCDITVLGTSANAWSEDDGTSLYLQTLADERRRRLPLNEVDVVAAEIAEFANCVRTGARPETGGTEAVEVIAVLEAIRESAETGRVVEVAGFRRGGNGVRNERGTVR